MPTFECVYVWMSVCVCLSSITARRSSIRPATTAAAPLISLLTSHSLISSRYHPEQWDGNASPGASCKRAVPESVASLFPSLPSSVRCPLSASLHFIPCSILIGLFNTVAAGWMSVDGRREIGRQLRCHAVIGTKTASALPLSLFPFSASQSFSFSIKLSYSFLFSRLFSFVFFCCSCCPHFILRWSSFTSPATLASAFAQSNIRF